MVPISGLEQGSKFTTNTSEDLKGVVLGHGNMGTSVYWYDIPEHYKKKHYDSETERDEKGNLYIGLDTLFYMKKMIIGSETSVIEITDKQKGE